MKKRSITAAGIVLILIAIGIAITLGGEANAATVSFDALGSRALRAEQFELERTSLALSLLDGSAARLHRALDNAPDSGLTPELSFGLTSGLNHGLLTLGYGLNSGLNSLTASAGELALRLDSADRSLDAATLAFDAGRLGSRLEGRLGVHLDALLLNA